MSHRSISIHQPLKQEVKGLFRYLDQNVRSSRSYEVTSYKLRLLLTTEQHAKMHFHTVN
jgi:hypothetical protein